jgi:hypothetical protein
LQISWRLFPSGFPEAATSAVVVKRYSDVVKLASALSVTHKGLYLKGTFPTVPKTQTVASDAVDVTIALLEFAGTHQQLSNSQVRKSSCPRFSQLLQVSYLVYKMKLLQVTNKCNVFCCRIAFDHIRAEL